MKLYSDSVSVACQCDDKGQDNYVIARCASWFRQRGITPRPYMGDQESALRNMPAATVQQLKVTATQVMAIQTSNAAR